MKIHHKAKENPLIAGAIALASVAVVIGAIWEGAELVDAAVMTEAEAAPIHLALEMSIGNVGDKIDTAMKLSECRYLSDKRDRLEYEIYVLTRDNADADLIQLKSTAFKRVAEKYRLLACATML